MNWAIFSLCFRDAVEAKGFWGHFNGTTPRSNVSKPKDSPAAPSTTEAPATAPQTGPSAEELALVAQWEKDERSGKLLLIQKIPDSALMKIRNKLSVKEHWDMIVREYTKKGTFAQTKLCACFLEMKYLDKGDVCQFLDDLHIKWEELVTTGVEIDEKDYCSTIISSLPIHLSNFASNQLAVARLYAPTKTINSDALISLISEESDCQRSQHAHRGNNSGKSKGDEKDEALYVTQGQSSKWKGGLHKFMCGICWNCGEKGHFKNKCPKPVKKDDSSKNSGGANAAIASNSEREGAFFMEPESDIDSDLPGSKGGYEEDGEDWFSEVNEEKAGSGMDTEELSEIDWSKCGSLVDVDLDSDAAKPNEFAAHVSAGNVDAPHAKIYNSGCSKHLTPYRNALEHFVEIPPKLFQAANKQNLSAVGMEEMTIDIPNGTDMSKLWLTEVLYAPEVGYTLVSVERLDEKGFEPTFSHGKCVIHRPKGEHVGVVSKTWQGLYHVAHEELETANAVEETITLDQFHCHMGHISPGVAHCLIKKGFVTGVCLEPKPSRDPMFCESYVYAKAI